jgi:hypothetical protein
MAAKSVHWSYMSRMDQLPLSLTNVPMTASTAECTEASASVSSADLLNGRIRVSFQCVVYDSIGDAEKLVYKNYRTIEYSHVRLKTELRKKNEYLKFASQRIH